MKQLCSTKYEQEIAEQEFRLLQQQITDYTLSCQSFESSPMIFQSTFIDSIQNPHTRQQTLIQYKEIIETARSTILTLYKKTAEKQRDESRKKCNASMKKMWCDCHSSSDNEKTPSIMINLIERRLNKISKRIQYIYRFKAVQSIHCKF